MAIGESTDNETDLYPKVINPIEFANFSSNHIELWSTIQGAVIHHSKYGAGEIIRIEQRTRYIPLISVLFENDNKEKTFNSDSFKSGIIETIQISESQNVALQNWKKQYAPVRKPKHINEQICFADFGVDSLWHISHFNNLQSIFQVGILSYYEAHKLYPELVDISDPEVQRWREHKPSNSIYRIHEYVPLYINPRNPMLYVRRNQQSFLCLIEIDLNVLDNNIFLLADGNAASSTTRFFKNQSDLKCLPWDVLKSDSWSDKTDGKRKRCSEVLLYPKIDPQYIKALHFREIVPSLDGVDKPKCITPELYF
jgi:ssDNA thymidine ADP-ribosyltransferase DarT-like protein